MRRLLSILLLAAPLSAVAAQDHVVSQKNKAFSVRTLAIKVGDRVVFRNNDDFLHNIFSLSDAMPFDLGAYSQGQTKTVTFGKPGKFDVECAIHPEMKLTVTVSP